MTAGRVSEDTSRSGPANASLSRRRPSAPRSVMTLMLTSSTSVSGAPGTLSGTPAPHGGDLVSARWMPHLTASLQAATERGCVGTTPGGFYGREARGLALIVLCLSLMS
jgi:hypothetical protein